jgi:hypothetical protein
MPDFRLGPQPVFSTTALDLFGPLEYKDMVRKRITGKGWGVIFVCTASSAIHLELTESYSTDAFLQALRRFMSMHGTPHTIISDRGEQLVAASRQVVTWDTSMIQDWMAEKKIKWKFAPVGGQHMNGQAERMIQQVKKVLKTTLSGKSCSFNELTTILFEAAVIVNSRPIGIAGRDSDLEAGTPITPLHLMLGRATIEAPQMDFNTDYNLTRRLQFVDEVKREFWHKWRAIVFQGLDRSYKWRQDQRDSQVGDVVLLKDETAAGDTYKLARVVEVFRNVQDARVREVTVAYKNFNEKSFRTSTRPIHKIVLVVPAEDANLPPLPAPGDPSDDLPASENPPGDLVTPDVEEPVKPASGGQDVASPASADPKEFIPASGDPEMVMPEPVVDVPTPAGPPVDQAAPDELPEEQPAPKGLPEDPGEQAEEEAAQGDRTHGGRLRPRKNFYSWDFPDRMKKM